MSKERILLGVAAVVVCAGAGVCFGAPVIEVWPSELNFVAIEGGSNPDAQILYLSNGGNGKLDWEITEDCTWLNVEPVSGTSFGEENEVTVSVDITGLSGGEYNCELTITDPDASNSLQVVTVNLMVFPEDGILLVPQMYPTIQAAIDIARSGIIHTIVVADGIYFGEGNRDIDFRGKTITIRSANGPNHCIIDCWGTDAQPHRGFIFDSGEGEGSVVDGFTVTGGYSYLGGGVYCEYSSPTIMNCVFIDNVAGNDGGGVYCYYESNPKLTNCVFVNNTAMNGGGGALFCDYFSNPRITDCLFEGNWADCDGGGVWCFTYSNLIIESSIFRSNAAGNCGGGIRRDIYSTLIMKDSIFINNMAGYGGGAVDGTWGYGGSVRNCVFRDNTALESGGAFINFSGTINNCFIVANSANYGSALAGCPSDIVNCTIVSNADSALDGGALMRCNETITNCIIWDNEPTDIYDCDAQIRYCCYPSAEGEGNIDVDPLFVDAAGGDYHLMPDSPCINTGDPNFVGEEGEVDIDGEPRVMGGRVDMGADEVKQVRIISVATDGSGDYLTIQAAIDATVDGDTIIVDVGTYVENINFGGKNIIVTSTKPYDWSVVEETVIDGSGLGTVVTFSDGETESCLLTGFSIIGGDADKGGGIYCSGSSPTITHCRIYNNISTDNYGGGGIHCFNGNLTVAYCLIEGNTGGFGGGLCGEETGMALIDNCLIAGNWANGRTFGGGFTYKASGGGAACFHGYILEITNCTISGNWAFCPTRGSAGGGGVCVYDLESAAIIKSSILWGNMASDPKEIRGVASVSYSDVEGGYEGDFNIDADPLFKDPGDWEIIVWYPGDFHLKSQAGRWDTVSESWVQDDLTSPGIDAGDPASDYCGELWPNGGRINMGAYGGTSEASMSLSDAGSAADMNCDDGVDMEDFGELSSQWQKQEILLKEDIDRDGEVGFSDLVMFCEEWML